MINCSKKMVCSVCGLCSKHCVGHTNMRAGCAPTEILGQCVALLRIVKDALVMVGRSDTRLIPEEAREAAKPTKRRRAA